MSKSKLPRILFMLVASFSLTTFPACANRSHISNQATTTGTAAVKSPPDLRDCGLVSTGSPSKYVCDDKTYTSYELTKLRSNYEAHQ